MQTEIPQVDPINTIRFLFGLSAKVQGADTLTIKDGIEAIESLSATELLGLNNLPEADDFVSAMNVIFEPAYNGARVSDPSLFILCHALMKVLGASRYRRGLSGGIERESFLVAPMVVILGQKHNDELGLNADELFATSGFSPRLLGFLSDRYGGSFSAVPPLLCRGAGIPSADPAEDDEFDDYQRNPCFDEIRSISRSALSEGCFDVDVVDSIDWYDKYSLSKPIIFRCNNRNQEFCFIRVFTFFLGLSHVSPLNSSCDLLATSIGMSDYIDASVDLRLDLPSAVGPNCSVILLRPRPFEDAVATFDSLNPAIAGMVGRYCFAISQASSFSAGHVPVFKSGDEYYFGGGISKNHLLEKGFPLLKGKKADMEFLEFLFRRICLANHVDIKAMKIVDDSEI